ncbi:MULTISPECIES: AI-2E family transporter [unclassified Clostridioides]|uniref:AI-2E family transporter n=1 Tax=unclassified Clostridioides TaxID=2635829 RepID=UPI001D11A7C0|nr:AI-2E family transporter [Clostridioides sp. ZZV14-6150]MCC0658811.1 AI-2E family transporter [Clostridioides sp. ZZV14-6154]MCC0721807.1 AI-2E family transporter [Clostridioides sp. ZZV14-6104]MCC0726807.1 AI-2E family transporter [Clostridioides sp. ZZV14-6045]MCC0730078.1 AI-2E family transporter [Clostridioides sp. ZZV14-6048]MCC0734462.1 AI-2E family transporter [Clostridioides sp. ZZV14-6009]MCC0741696.1 AI-2E family transporter [Clostridioides sp. ZZV14-6044]MCC0750875.1 AI-2E fami
MIIISKETVKYYLIVVFIGILFFKFINTPADFISSIEGLLSFFSPFLLAILLALLLNPLVMLFEIKFKTHRLLSIFLSYILIGIILAFGIRLLIPSIANTLNRLINEMPIYTDYINNFIEKNMSNIDFLKALIPHIQHSLDNALKEASNFISRIPKNFLIYTLSISSMLFSMVMGFILSIYIIYDKEKIALGFKRLLYSSTTRNKADDIIEFFRTTHDIFYDYLIGRILDSLIIGIIAFIGFQFIIRIENALFLASIIFLANIIPYLGPFIGAIPPVAMTILYSPQKTIWVIVFIFILQQLDGNFIEPKVMGNQVGIGAIWIISAILIGQSLFGFIGVFLSVPVAAVVKTSIDKYIDKRLQ